MSNTYRIDFYTLQHVKTYILYADSFIYVIYNCLRIVVSYTCCIVYLLCLSSSCGPFVASLFVCPFMIVPSAFSNVYIMFFFYQFLLYIYIYHYPIQYIKNCWVRLLSNYNIKYICTIYTRLYTCLPSIPRFALRDKVTLRFEWCCSVSMVWVQITSREEQKFDSSKIWF
jgi:hypothetical protein